jgi:5S rRNA maturation endonuclease (ribonuclease M5)
MRVESDTPTRNGGWLHRTKDPIPYIPVRRAIPERVIDFEKLWLHHFEKTSEEQVDDLGIRLGVDTDALRAIGCAWFGDYSAFGFPMRDATRKVIGIRLRNDAGQKWAVKGSHQGLFVPTEYPFDFDGTLYIVEGPTDLAAALTIGLFAIGRPACLGQEQMIMEYIRAQKARRVVIVADNDDPGLRGAAKLQSALPVPSCVWTPPTKDIREFLKLGGKGPMIEACIKDTVWTCAEAA